MILLLQYTLSFAAVLLIVALGGCFSEHSGVLNIGLEGTMVIGALGGALTMKFLPVSAQPFMIVLSAVFTSMAAGMLFSMLLAVASIHLYADQTLVGMAMNMMGVAAATIIVKAVNTAENSSNISSTIQYIDQKKAFV